VFPCDDTPSHCLSASIDPGKQVFVQLNGIFQQSAGDIKRYITKDKSKPEPVEPTPASLQVERVLAESVGAPSTY
jgi:hypothetical protein